MTSAQTEPVFQLAQIGRRAPRPTGAGRIRLAALRVPLLAKLLGANLLVVALLVVAAVVVDGASGLGMVVIAAGAFLLTTALVLVALRPIRDLEDAAARVWQGDFGARVDRSALADHDVLRVGTMFNLLLDGLSADRARMRALAAEVIAVGDKERAELAYELHDSTAQQLAALVLQLSAAARDCKDPQLAERLASARDTAAQLTDEVRLLAHDVHPRVLDDLGLVAALKKLARDSSRRSGVDVDASLPESAQELPATVATVLYRVAEESVRNALRHAAPRTIRLSIEMGDAEARLEVRDDGAGFDAAAAASQARGKGLLLMRDRLALVDGQLDVRTAPGGGTSIIATVPLVGTAPRNSRG